MIKTLHTFPSIGCISKEFDFVTHILLDERRTLDETITYNIKFSLTSGSLL